MILINLLKALLTQDVDVCIGTIWQSKDKYPESKHVLMLKIKKLENTFLQGLYSQAAVI